MEVLEVGPIDRIADTLESEIADTLRLRNAQNEQLKDKLTIAADALAAIQSHPMCVQFYMDIADKALEQIEGLSDE